MKIYTKQGDGGDTQLLGGQRVPKSHRRIVAYGTVDELNSHLGLVRALAIDEHFQDVLLAVQKKLFLIGSHLAQPPGTEVKDLDRIAEVDIELLEKEIDKMQSALPELKKFILPGGDQSVAQCHIARSVSRRTEREVRRLAEAEAVDTMILKYLNRLSDYLFVLARSIAYDDEVEEIKWAG